MCILFCSENDGASSAASSFDLEIFHKDIRLLFDMLDPERTGRVPLNTLEKMGCESGWTAELLCLLRGAGLARAEQSESHLETCVTVDEVERAAHLCVLKAKSRALFNQQNGHDSSQQVIF